jgi:outer membrane biosynthesis protein TonB
MSTTEIPPRAPVPAPEPRSRPYESDLYDAERWEMAFRELHDAPALLVQLQDDLSRSRQREAFWISVVFHLTLVILVVNSQKLQERFFHRRPVVMISPQDMLRQKDLTYLELPPDEQKVTKKSDSNIISDKDRIATSRTPQLNRDELKKILDSARAGAPGPRGPTASPQPSQQPSPAVAPNPQTQQDQAGQEAVPPPPDQNQVARLQTPPVNRPKPSFSTSPMSPGAAIDQAARAALANRGGYGGTGGDFGLSQGRQPAQLGQLDVLSDTMGVDFAPYLARVVQDVRENWYRIIPESARAPLMKKGKVSIEFAIMRNGSVKGMALAGGGSGSSGDIALDRAAWGGITASDPFPPLPNEFGGQYLALRFHFYYNPEKADLQ